MAFGYEDRRKAPRRQVDHPAAIVNPWGAPVRCQILDLSSIGARVATQDAPAADSFFLIDLEMKVAHRAEVVWRSPPEMGVRIAETWRLTDDHCPAWLRTAADKASGGRRKGLKGWFRSAA